jgi:hypothetical protein
MIFGGIAYESAELDVKLTAPLYAIGLNTLLFAF